MMYYSACMSDDSLSKTKVELDFLTAIERGEVITQMTLKHRVGVSVGLINALLKRAMNKGFVKVRQAPYKRYAYYLTPQGFAEKSRLVATYLENSMNFLRDARVQYEVLFDESLRRGKRSFVFAGAGELAEIALLSMRGKDIEKIVIYDTHYPHEQFSGISVIKSVEDISGHDLIIMTNAKDAQLSFEELRQALPKTDIVWPPLLHITPDKEDLIRING